MIDAALLPLQRRLLTPPGQWLAARGVRADQLTVAGCLVGLAAAGAAALELYGLALLGLGGSGGQCTGGGSADRQFRDLGDVVSGLCQHRGTAGDDGTGVSEQGDLLSWRADRRGRDHRGLCRLLPVSGMVSGAGAGLCRGLHDHGTDTVRRRVAGVRVGAFCSRKTSGKTAVFPDEKPGFFGAENSSFPRPRQTLSTIFPIWALLSIRA